jgi:hypothetical protein
MRLIIGTIVAALGAGDAAAACGGTGRLVYTDAFDKLGADWGTENRFVKVTGGELVITQQDRSYSLFAQPGYRDVDYCATIRLTESSKLSGSYGGLAFWARDNDRYFTFQITLDGYGTVYEYNYGDWTSLIDDRAFAAIKKGIGAVNELRVVTRGPNATLYVNGQKFDTLQAKGTPGTQRIGFSIEGPEGANSRATFAFDNVEVRNN